MIVFIVGATGGVGHRVAQRLRASGHAVTAIARRAEQAERLVRQGITPIIADIAVRTVGDRPPEKPVLGRTIVERKR